MCTEFVKFMEALPQSNRLQAHRNTRVLLVTRLAWPPSWADRQDGIHLKLDPLTQFAATGSEKPLRHLPGPKRRSFRHEVEQPAEQSIIRCPQSGRSAGHAARSAGKSARARPPECPGPGP